MRARDLLEMRNFVAVAELLSFARAAERAGVTPSAISQSIRHLESQVGTRLFLRTTRQVSLTRAGERMLREVKPALDALEQAHAILRDLSQEAPGPLRLTLPQVAAEQLVVPALPAFARRFPMAEIELSIDNGLIDLSVHPFDAGVRRGRLVNANMVAKRISPNDTLVTVASPGYLDLRGEPRRPHDLRLHSTIWIRYRSTRLISPWRFSSGHASVVVKPDARLVVDDVSVAREIAIAGMGIARLARSYVQSALDRGELHSVLDHWQASLTGFYLYYRRESRTSPPLRAFQDFMCARQGAVGPL